VDSRTRILDRIRSARVPKVALPDLTAGKIAGDNLQMFSEMLVSIGGSIFRVGDYAEVQQHIVKQYAHASRIISVVPDLPWFQSNFSSDPHDFQDVDLVVMNGHFAVAENGAIWLTDDLMGDRSLPFITQHLALVVPASEIISTLSEAYERITRLSFQFGTFIAGPSKTADIEQSLVLGAHGPKSLTVFLMK